MKTAADVTVDGKIDGYVSLSKLTGLKIKDIKGYVSKEFGDPVFKMSFIVLDNGVELWCEGEHDMSYIGNAPKSIPELGDEFLNVLYSEQNPDSED